MSETYDNWEELEEHIIEQETTRKINELARVENEKRRINTLNKTIEDIILTASDKVINDPRFTQIITEAIEGEIHQIGENTKNIAQNAEDIETNANKILEVAEALSTKYELGVGIEIPVDADLNNYKTPGVYRGTTAANTPNSETNFTMVITDSLEQGYPRQTFTSFATGWQYTRLYSKDTNTWLGWSVVGGNQELGKTLGVRTYVQMRDSSVISNNLLNVDLHNRDAEINKPIMISVGDDNDLIGFPTVHQGWPYIAVRTVDFYGENRVVATIEEAFPVPGRKFVAHYNSNQWEGWYCSGGINAIIAEGTSNGFHWVKYENGVAKAWTQSSYIHRNFSSPYGSWYTPGAVGFSLPFPFTSIDNVQCSYFTTGELVGTCVHSVSTTEVWIYAYSPVSKSMPGAYFVEVSGYWK